MVGKWKMYGWKGWKVERLKGSKVEGLKGCAKGIPLGENFWDGLEVVSLSKCKLLLNTGTDTF